MDSRKVVAVSLEHRFYRFEDCVYTKLSFPYQYWEDYLTYFDKVVVIARVEKVSSLPTNYQKVSGPGVEFFDFPYYVGPFALIKKSFQIIARARTAALTFDAFLLRSGNVSNFIWLFLMLYNKPYLREYPGNIKEGVEGVAGKKLHTAFLASFLHYFAKFQGRYSRANSFVSRYCEDLYGSRRPGYIFSSFQLSEIENQKSNYELSSSSPAIISVGRLEGEKGHMDLICALSLIAKRSNTIPRLHLIGDGRQFDTLKNLCIAEGVDCQFYGSVTDRNRLFDIVRAADLFVMPSHTEGMPRALLEAMAIGMPCIGTKAGGIPEVLSDEALVDPSNPEQLANIILSFISSSCKRKAQGQLNAEMARSKFGTAVVVRQKLAFWRSLYE